LLSTPGREREGTGPSSKKKKKRLSFFLDEQMIEHLCVFTKGGRVLWNFTFAGDRSFNAPVNDLVRLVLLEVTGKAHTCLITQWNWGEKKQERASRSEYETDAYGLRWAFDNSLELVYVVSTEREKHKQRHVLTVVLSGRVQQGHRSAIHRRAADASSQRVLCHVRRQDQGHGGAALVRRL